MRACLPACVRAERSGVKMTDQELYIVAKVGVAHFCCRLLGGGAPGTGCGGGCGADAIAPVHTSDSTRIARDEEDP